MQKILFMMPGYYGFNEVVNDGLTKYSGFTVNNIDTATKKVYRNISDRAINFFSKFLLSKNLKPLMREKRIFQSINKFEKYDYLIVNRADIISPTNLDLAFSKSRRSVLILWDSLHKIPTDKSVLSKFDVVYSFDQEDCRKFGFEKIENFHFFDSIDQNITPKYDAVFLGTLDSRIEKINAVIKTLKENNNKSVKAYLYSNAKKDVIFSKNIEIFSDVIPFKNAYQYALNGKVIIDIGHDNQSGLSFRFFEAMAFRKKIITTNKSVINYDFYRSDNIFIIEDIDEIEIPDTFWNEPYKELSIEMVDKYHLKNWVYKIIYGK